MDSDRVALHRVIRNAVLLAAIPAAVLLASGCAYIGVAAALAMRDGSGGGGGTAGVAPVEPVVILGAVGPRLIGAATVDYQLQDANGDSVDVAVEFSSDGGGTYFSATISNPDTGVTSGNVITGVAATGALANHNFDWDALTDLGAAAVTTVQLRLLPTDATGLPGLESVSATFTTGNDAPQVAITNVPDLSGIVPVELTVYDSTRDVCDLQIEQSFSTDGGATFSPLAPAAILFPVPQGVSSDPPPTGRLHTFAWDSLNDVQTLNALVRLQVTPDDTFDVGTTVVSNDFTVSNNDAPAAFISEVGRQDGIVQIDFILVDPQQDQVDVVFDYTLDPTPPPTPPPPASFSPVTIDSGPTTGLSSDGTAVHSVFWDSGADLGAAAVSGVRLRITPSDAGGVGTDYLSTFFEVGNDPPTIVLDPIGGTHNEGVITVSFTLTDTTGDPADLDVRWSTDGGAAFSPGPATIEVGSVVNVAPSPGQQKISWNSIADLGQGDFLNVVVKVTPCDDETGAVECGVADTTGVFRALNVDRPVGFIASPSVGDAVEGAVTVSYLVFDANSDPLNIVMEHSTDDGATFTPSTERTGPPSEGTLGLSSRPDGERHDFVWDTDVDLPGMDLSLVRLQVTPSDLQGAGLARAMDGPFLVNNNDEPGVRSIGGLVGDQTGSVALSYILEDTEGDVTTVAVDFSTDGGATFTPATLANPDEGTVSGNEISGLSTAAAGFSHSFDWVSTAGLPGVRETGVVLRIEPRDNVVLLLGLGVPGQTSIFTVDNTTPPEVQNLLNGSTTGTIRVDYDLLDFESSTINLVVEFSTDGGVVFNPASLTGADEGVWSPGQIAGVSSSPLGLPHWLDWDSTGDIGPTNLGGVILRVTPTDTKFGIADTVSVDVTNNDAPVVLINNIIGLQTGDVNLPYRLRDSFGDTCTIIVEYRIGAGSFAAATEGAGGDGTSGLTSGPLGQEAGHLYVWDSMSDISTTVHNDIVIRITANDGTTPGSPAVSNLFTVDNALSADLLLGFDTFVQSRVDGRGLEATGAGDGGLAYDGTNLYIVDPGGNRCLILFGIPTSTFQMADRVVGQPEFSTNVPNFPAFQVSTDKSLNFPRGAYTDGTRLYVADTDNHRVLVWNTIPSANFAAADFVLGQADFASNSANRGGPGAADTLNTPNMLHGDSTQLYVGDTGNHRVLIYNLPITANGQAAGYVLGQLDFATVSANQGGAPTAGTLSGPRGIFTDGTTLYVADRDNSRVLIWTIPGTWSDGDLANLVLGQTVMSGGNPNDPALGPGTLNLPNDVFDDGTSVYVADRDNNRVVIYNLPIVMDGQPGDVFVGQPDGTSSGRETTPEGLAAPTGVLSTGSKLLIYDGENSRVKIHNSIPVANDEPADLVFGQRNLIEGGANHADITAFTFRFAAGLDTDGNSLFVADWDNARVLGWSIVPDVSNKNADVVFGQSNFTDTNQTISPAGLDKPMDVAYDGAGPGRLFVADTNNSRVVIYTGPFGVGDSGSSFLGQPDGVTNTPGTTISKMNVPGGVSWDGTRLWVADSGNHRVLRFSAFGPGDPADRVVGQADFNSGGADHSGTDGVGDRSLNNPLAVVASGNGPGATLAVGDEANHRVMIWNALPTADDEVATLVLGQTGFTVGGAAGLGRAGLNSPVGVESRGGALYVMDGANFRLLIWDAIPAAGSHGAPADRIIGQPDFQSAAPNNGGVSARALFTFRFWTISPAEVTSGPTTYLWVPDILNNRVLRFDVTP